MSSTRPPKTRLRTAKGRPTSSTHWLTRQLADPYVARAKAQGYRSRAAYKLLEMEEKLHLLRPGAVVLDLGSAPGGWSQVAAQRGCRVVASDILPMEEIEGVAFVQMDFTDEDAPQRLKDLLGGGADVVLSDMAPNTTGHKATDHVRIIALAEMAYALAVEVLRPGGALIMKIWQGGAQGELQKALLRDFDRVRTLKPPASRKDSAECYVVGMGFRRTQL